MNQDLLKEHFEYRDGHLWWIKPRARAVKVGQQFGTFNHDGYRQGVIYGKHYLEHRLVWLLHYGLWPKNQLDHINGIKHNNRIENLRECTQSQNQFNRKGLSGTSSQYKGVSLCKKTRKWRAKAWRHGKEKSLGYFKTELEAAKVYDDFTKEFHGDYHRPNIKD